MLINGKRALAHIQQIHDIQPIEGADNIELVHVLGWSLIAKKGEFKDGDLAVYIEIDSKVPSTDERFTFLEKKGYKVKTYKLSKFGVVSQGLALPITLFPELTNLAVNTDVTDLLHITYSVEEDNARKNPKKTGDEVFKAISARKPNLFKKPIIKWLMKRKWGRWIVKILFSRKKKDDTSFPSEYCSKTDEERIQNMPYILNDKEGWIVTEKIDGTSSTYVLVRHKRRFRKAKYEFIVSSRNVRQLDPNQGCYHDTNVYWEMAEKYDLKNKMIEMLSEQDNGWWDYVVLQGETYGEGIQGNKYKLNEHRLAIFNVIFGRKGEGYHRMSTCVAKFMMDICDIPFVPVIHDLEDFKYTLPDTVDELLQDATGPSVINPDVLREGWVLRKVNFNSAEYSGNYIISFKAVSPEFLMKHKL